MAADFLVSKSGIAQKNYPYIDSAVKRLRSQAAARASSAAAASTAAPQTFVNDTTKGVKGIINRAKPAIKKGAGTIAKKVIAPMAVVGAMGQATNPGATSKYYERFGLNEPTSEAEATTPGAVAKFAAARGLGFASDAADNFSGGIVGNLLYRDKRGQGGGNSLVSSAQAEPTPTPTPTPTPLNDGGVGGGQIDIGNSSADTPSGSDRNEVSVNDTVSALAGDQKFVPGRGKGIIRNNTTGEGQIIDGEPESSAETPNPNGGSLDVSDRQNVKIPNLADAMSAGTLPIFLQQLSQAQQANVNNNAASGKRKSIISGAKEKREAEKSGIDTKRAAIDLKREEQVQTVLDELNMLDESNDPGGLKRLELQKKMVSLQGKKGGDKFQLGTAFGEADDFGAQQKQLVRFNQNTGEYDVINPSAAQSAPEPGGGDTPPMEGAQRAPDGNWYVQQDGKWHKVE